MAQACQSFELHEHLKLSGVGDCQMWKHRLMFMQENSWRFVDPNISSCP